MPPSFDKPIEDLDTYFAGIIPKPQHAGESIINPPTIAKENPRQPSYLDVLYFGIGQLCERHKRGLEVVPHLQRIIVLYPPFRAPFADNVVHSVEVEPEGQNAQLGRVNDAREVTRVLVYEYV